MKANERKDLVVKRSSPGLSAEATRLRSLLFSSVVQQPVFLLADTWICHLQHAMPMPFLLAKI
jgi:hypothetical protein